MTTSTLWVVAYDIADPTRLRKVARRCEDTGQRIQQSIFVCACDAEAFRSLQADVQALIDPAADRLLALPLCRRCVSRLEQHGVAVDLPNGEGPVVV
jgi:CRISPR-associated protein Cas2